MPFFTWRCMLHCNIWRGCERCTVLGESGMTSSQVMSELVLIGCSGLCLLPTPLHMQHIQWDKTLYVDQGRKTNMCAREWARCDAFSSNHNSQQDCTSRQIKASPEHREINKAVFFPSSEHRKINKAPLFYTHKFSNLISGAGVTTLQPADRVHGRLTVARAVRCSTEQIVH